MPIYKLNASKFSTAEREEFTGDEGRLFYELDDNFTPSFYISDGDTVGGIPVAFAGGGGVNQTLSLTGNALSISGGNTVDLSNIAVSIDLSNLTTDDLAEGTTNLYYDDSLVANYITNNPLTQVTIDGATLQWYGVDNTLQLVYNNGVTYELGQEEFMYIKSLDTISKGQVVMFAGALGTHIKGVRADQSVQGFQPEWIIGIAAQDFAVNEFGYVETFGKVTDIDTSMYTDGTILYMDPDNPGELTDIVPSVPDHIIQMAAVINAHKQQGAIFVRPTHKPDTDEVIEGLNNLYYTEARFDESMKYNLSEAPPTSSIGVPGDETGLIRADDTYIYYCWADYDGTTNIWKRVAFSTENW
jgi:hypothetical protein